MSKIQTVEKGSRHDSGLSAHGTTMVSRASFFCFTAPLLQIPLPLCLFLLTTITDAVTPHKDLLSGYLYCRKTLQQIILIFSQSLVCSQLCFASFSQLMTVCYHSVWSRQRCKQTQNQTGILINAYLISDPDLLSCLS